MGWWLLGGWALYKIFGGPKLAPGQGRGGDVLDVANAVAGGGTSLKDGIVTIAQGGGHLMACNKKWWPVEKGLVCCKAASGRTVTHDDSQIVCAIDDETASYIWKKVGG